jgi:hypothetical protein
MGADRFKSIFPHYQASLKNIPANFCHYTQPVTFKPFSNALTMILFIGDLTH